MWSYSYTNIYFLTSKILGDVAGMTCTRELQLILSMYMSSIATQYYPVELSEAKILAIIFYKKIQDHGHIPLYVLGVYFLIFVWRCKMDIGHFSRPTETCGQVIQVTWFLILNTFYFLCLGVTVDVIMHQVWCTTIKEHVQNTRSVYMYPYMPKSKMSHFAHIIYWTLRRTYRRI